MWAGPSINQCMNNAIRMMIGIGMPRNNSSNDLMMKTSGSWKNLFELVATATSKSGGKTGEERANQ